MLNVYSKYVMSNALTAMELEKCRRLVKDMNDPVKMIHSALAVLMMDADNNPIRQQSALSLERVYLWHNGAQ